MIEQLERRSATNLLAPKTKLPYFRELDGLRGVAAMAVFVHHFFQSNPSTNWIVRLTRYGSSGVDVFFVLSGYLITSLLLVDRDKPNYYHNFYWKRALRILPVYFVFLIATRRILGNASWEYIGLCLVFMANFAQRFTGIQTAAWTLSIEEQFYLIWPSFVRRLRLTSLYYLAFTLVLTSVLLRIVVPLATGKMAVIYTPYRFDGLGLGAILAMQWFEAETPRPIQVLLKVLNSNLLLMIALIGAAAFLSILNENLFVVGARIGIVNYLTYRIIRRIIGRQKQGWLGRSVPVFFGRISYSFYLYHSLVFYWVAAHFGPLGGSPALFVISLAAAIAMSTVSLYAMELPVQRLRRFVLLQ
jgi:peptidoglycan/LPS O-acetylase OafA/YrhL